MEDQSWTGCPKCGYTLATESFSSNGEASIQCYLCSFYEDFSDIQVGYYDSKEEKEDYEKELQKNNHTPSKEQLMAAKKITRTLSSLNVKINKDDLIQVIETSVINGVADINIFCKEMVKIII